MPQTFTHDPDAERNYTINWSLVLDDADTTLASATWDVPDGLTEESTSNTSTAAIIRLSGGDVGTTYRVTCHAVFADGQEDDRSIYLVVEER